MRLSKNAILVLVVLAVVALILALAGPTEARAANRAKVTDPHEGQVYLYDGFDWIWMTPIEGVPVNDIAENDISWQGGKPSYAGDAYTALRGVDVSEHQHDVDWARVKAAGIDYAVIRLGRRGYSEGGLFEDDFFKQNMDGALDAGLQVGVYFFSQAVTVAEALEEADLTLRLLEPYRGRVTMPVVFDWEKIYDDDSARTAGLDVGTLTDCAVAYCERVKAAGYQPGVYFNRHTGYYGFDLTRIQDYHLWFALPEARFPNFYYATDMWQYSFEENVPGIDTPTDVNLFFIRNS